MSNEFYSFSLLRSRGFFLKPLGSVFSCHKDPASAIREISATFPGFRFSPTDTELISHYLKRKMDGSNSNAGVIAEVEICKFEPWDLPANSIIESDHEWFFLAQNDKKYPNGSRANRATQFGFWKANAKERNIKSGKNVIGTKRTLVFHIGRSPKGKRTGWILNEYCLKEHKGDKCFTNGSWVMYRLRKKQDSTDRATESNVRENLQQMQVGVRGDGEDDVVNTMEDDCFTDILKDDIVNLDYHQLYVDPLLPNTAECSTVQVPNLPASSSKSPVNQCQGNAQRRIRMAIRMSRRNRGKMLIVGDEDSSKSNDVEGGHVTCLITSLAKSKTSLLMTMAGGLVLFIFFIMVASTLFFQRVV